MRVDRRSRISARVVVAARTEFRAMPSPRTITLLDLVSELAEDSENDAEIVASVMDLVNSGGVRLIQALTLASGCGRMSSLTTLVSRRNPRTLTARSGGRMSDPARS